MQLQPIHEPQGDGIYEHLKALYYSLKDIDKDREVSLDMRNVTWTPPLIAGPLAALINSRSFYHLLPANLQTRSYLQTVKFPEGVSSPTLVNANRSYIPICTVLQANRPAYNELETAFQEKLFSRCGFNAGARSVFFLPISELTTNLVEHSNADRGHLIAQDYQRKGYLDVVIVDTGQGVAASYASGLGLNLTHEEALLKAVGGLSSSPSDERGFGIPTSLRAVARMRGAMMLISGDCAYVADSTSQQMNAKAIHLPGFEWDGLIVFMRIPHFDYPIAYSEIA